MHIFRNQMLIYPHILSYVERIKHSDICAVIERIKKETEALGIKLNGNIMTTVKKKSVEIDEELFEIEFLIPINRQVEDSLTFIYKSQFKLINAIKARYEGDITEIKKSEILLKEYMEENDLEPITGYYSSYVQALKDSPDSVIVDIYVGINANIL